MLQSDFRMRTQPESQGDGSAGAYNRNPARLTPVATDSGAPVYRRPEGGPYMSYQPSSSHQIPVGLSTSTGPSQSGYGGGGGSNDNERGNTSGGVIGRHRMSLLHPPLQSMEYAMPINPRPDVPSPQRPSMYGGLDNTPGSGGIIKMIQLDTPPCKKLRLGDTKSDVHSPLRIDTDRARTGPAYNPEVEAISPILPSDNIKDDPSLDNWKSSKDELLNKLGQIDREIARTESEIGKLKKKEVELEELATRPRRETDHKAAPAEPVICSLPQSIYAENRAKAAAAHGILDKLGPRVELPLYNQPSDTAVYQENKQKFLTFKSTLQNYFRFKVKEKRRREEYLATTYAQLSTEWTKRMEKIENSGKRRNRDAKNRETFEKVFPELRKQREDKERFSRVGSRIKSDADMEEIIDGIQEQELENKKMRSYAVIPPILLDEVSRRRRFANRNGLIEEPMQEYKDKQIINLWTEQEKDIFKEKYLQHPKNFGIIKSYLERKGVADCVQYYYMSKKANNYRQLLRKSRARTRSSRNNQQANSSTGAGVTASSIPGLPVIGGSSVKVEPNGVTTRLQKEQKNDNNGAVEGPNQSSLENQVEGGNLEAGGTTEDPNFEEGEDITMEPQASIITTQIPIQTEYLCTNKKKRKEGLKDAMNELDTSDEDNAELNGDKGIPHNCVVCKSSLDSYLQSRPLLRSQAQQYGLPEEDIQTSDRVCTSCRCKAVRRRFKPSHCPIPTCPARKARIKRLRPFPPKWAELSQENKDAICNKYQIPSNVTKCCTACFNRINRRLMPNASLDTPDDPSSDTTRWLDEEIESVKKALTEFGTDWRQLSERIGTKSDLQCRNFYFNFRKKHGLDALVQEFRKSKGVDGPPILTDEEESGSTTSSCDEGVAHTQEVTRPPRENKKDDYDDTSATVSAEEVDEKPHAQQQNAGKTFPTNPSVDVPLQLTIKEGQQINAEGNDLNSTQAREQCAPHHKQALLHPVPPGHAIMAHNSLYRQSQGQSLQPQQGPYHVSTRESPNSAFHLHPSPSHHIGNSHEHEQRLQLHVDQGHHGRMRHPSPEGSETHEPISVKDIMLATIERQLRKNPVAGPPTNHSQNAQSQGGPPPQSVSPTIQSILKSHERTHLPPPAPVVISSGQQLNHHQHSQHFQHPIYFSSSPKDMRQGHMLVRENVPVVHIQHAALKQPPPQPPPQNDYETLDLSMKKRTPSPQVTVQRPPSSGGHPPPAHQSLDYSRQQQDVYYPKFPMNRSRLPQQLPPQKQNKVLPPPPLLTKPPTVSPHSNLKDGSITHGTPLHMAHPHQQIQPSKYEGLLKPMKEGSITHGTPLDKVRGKEQSSSPYMYDRSPDNYKRMSPASYSFHGAQPQQFYNQKSPSGHRSPPLTGPHPSNYSAEQHNTSRQIIINDYYTSQQMQQAPPPPQHLQQSQVQQQQPRMDMSKRGPLPSPVSAHHGHSVYILPPRNEIPSYRQSPPPGQHHQQQRQGVIHRTNQNRPVIKQEQGRYSQQHDAFASLVDIAAAQPSLPVPKDDPRPHMGLPRVDVVREGLGKSMMDMERNRLSIPPHPQASQMLRVPSHQPPMTLNMHDSSRNRKDGDGRYVREGTQDATLTAASLIDAIITHQINQPSVHDRQSPIPSSRTGDRLFASFQRCVQPPGVPSGMHQPSSHLSPNRMSQMERMERPPVQSQHVPQQHLNEEIRMEEGQGMEHRNAQGGTWGDQIDMIISKDYASRKGISMGRPTTSTPVATPPGLSKNVPVGSQQHSNTQQQYVSTHPKTQEDVGPYISWKLRRALQHEKEQQQQQLYHMSDERHIIRVVQVDQQQQHQHSASRPPSAPTKESNFSYSGEASPDLKDPVNTVDQRDQPPNKKPREGMSPLDYVKNRIMEVMRKENKEDKGGGGGSDEVGPPDPRSTPPTLPVTGGSSGATVPKSTVNPPASGSSSYVPSAVGSTEPDIVVRQPEKEDLSQGRGGTESPIPMVIDESGGVPSSEDDGRDKGVTTVSLDETTTRTRLKSHAKYEPLTDEEGG